MASNDTSAADVRQITLEATEMATKVAGESLPAYMKPNTSWKALPGKLIEQRRQILTNPKRILNRPAEWFSPLVFALALLCIPCLAIEACSWSLSFSNPAQVPLSSSDEEALLAITKQLAGSQKIKPDSAKERQIAGMRSELNTLKAKVNAEEKYAHLAAGLNLIDEMVAFPLQLFLAARLFKFLVSRFKAIEREVSARADDIYLYYFSSCGVLFLVLMYAGIAVVKGIDAWQLPQLDNAFGDGLLAFCEIFLASTPLVIVLKYASGLSTLLSKPGEVISWWRKTLIGGIFLSCLYLSDFFRLAVLTFMASGWAGLLAPVSN